MTVERVFIENMLAAEVLRSTVDVESTTFFSDASSTLQIGIMKHQTGFVEEAHIHNEFARSSSRTQQFFIVLEGTVAVDFFSPSGSFHSSLILNALDSILLIDGGHRIRTISESKCVTLKQGPYVSLSEDRVILNISDQISGAQF